MRRFPRMPVLVVISLAAVLLMTACPGGDDQAEKVFRASSLVAAPSGGSPGPGRTRKKIGEQCFVGADCEEEICFRYQPGSAAPRACSRHCTTDDDCPGARKSAAGKSHGDWACLEVYPAPDAVFCVPPGGWRPRVALERTGDPASPNDPAALGASPPPPRGSPDSGIGSAADGGVR